MCVIAVSRSGMVQPSRADLLAMWNHNPDGAGYMFARSGIVEIHKGFMTFNEFWRAVRSEQFTESDAVVYHFRISTQAGRTPQMTHPFPLTRNLSSCELLDVSCPVGIAHNGIIPVTTDRTETRYSDTALFITKYMSKLIRSRADLSDPAVLDEIEKLGGWSKFAIMAGNGEIVTIGHWTKSNGYLVSNRNHILNADFPGAIWTGKFTREHVKN